jgi:V8-like Glu-specific endopeptidase
MALTEAALAKDQAVARTAAAGTIAGQTGAGHAREQAGRVVGTVYVIGSAGQAAARSYWTPARMAAATGTGVASSGVASSGAASSGVASSGAAGTASGTAAPAMERQDAVMGASASQEPPRGTPDSQSFSGVPTVGALFYTKGNSNHFCTASVIRSTVGSLVLTAAHCVYTSKGYSQNMEFVPGYDEGSQSYGVWPVTQITVAKGWRQGENPDLDVAFLNVAPPPNSVGPIAQVTGALQIAFALPDAQHITVIGYNNTDQRPIMCSTTSFKFRTDQMEFHCSGFWYGTSGGPWILNYDSGQGTGTVYGVIGGYEAGGYVSWASFAAALEKPAQELLAQAEASASTAVATSAKSGTAKSGTAKPGTSAGTEAKATVG